MCEQEHPRVFFSSSNFLFIFKIFNVSDDDDDDVGKIIKKNVLRPVELTINFDHSVYLCNGILNYTASLYGKIILK